MAFAPKFLRPLPRAFVFASSSSSSFFNPVRFCCVKFQHFKSFPTNFGSLLCNRISNFRLAFSGANGIYLRKSPLIGSQFSKGTILGASVVFGSISLWPNASLAMDDRLMDAPQEDLDASDYVKSAKIFWELALRLWLPFLLCWTVLINLNHPILVVGKVVLFLVSTKPSPLSVYIFVEKLRSSSSQEPHLSNWKKCLFARKVEVEDYKLLCVAKVEMKHQKFTLVGILGGWWKWPPFSSDDEFIAFMDKLAFLAHRLKSIY
ncbi:uncharacterized protein LOC120090109 [Benincasa hispida]|uniref:uncharacterized protein LOC120090109 n=1 Tax=Benincasa hispida TaxID=102211 RepID=UPI0019006C74|nr:uncharacterized protein LOC120090109 [Benincasa hispida]